MSGVRVRRSTVALAAVELLTLALYLLVRPPAPGPAVVPPQAVVVPAPVRSASPRAVPERTPTPTPTPSNTATPAPVPTPPAAPATASPPPSAPAPTPAAPSSLLPSAVPTPS